MQVFKEVVYSGLCFPLPRPRAITGWRSQPSHMRANTANLHIAIFDARSLFAAVCNQKGDYKHCKISTHRCIIYVELF